MCRFKYKKLDNNNVDNLINKFIDFEFIYLIICNIIYELNLFNCIK